LKIWKQVRLQRERVDQEVKVVGKEVEEEVGQGAGQGAQGQVVQEGEEAGPGVEDVAI
jgi:hypothetical protein